MTIKEFIEDAVKGGWRKGEEMRWDDKHGYGLISTMKKNNGEGLFGYGLNIHDMTDLWLDPKAWEAVGKVKNWDGGYDCGSCEYPGAQDDPQYHMSEMIKALCSGKTLEKYIATL